MMSSTVSGPDCKKVLIPKDQRKWQYFVGASAVIYFGGLILVLIGRLLYILVKRGQRRNRSVADIQIDPNKKAEEEQDAGWYIALKEGAGALVSAQTLQGRILVSLRNFGLKIYTYFYPKGIILLLSII